MKSEIEIKKKMSEWHDMSTEFFLLKAKAPTDKMEEEMYRKQLVALAWVEALEWVLEEKEVGT